MILTAVNDTGVMDVLDSLEDGPHQACCIAISISVDFICVTGGGLRLIVVSLRTYPIKKLSACTKIEDEIEVVGGLRLISIVPRLLTRTYFEVIV